MGFCRTPGDLSGDERHTVHPEQADQMAARVDDRGGDADAAGSSNLCRRHGVADSLIQPHGGSLPIFPMSHGRIPVLYSGPSLAYHQAFAAPDMSHTVLTSCGSPIAHDTWLIVTGKASEPGLQG
jgi:hypothetical protein